jgi:hypothetical protein
MSMCLGLVALSDANIARVLQDPPLVWRVIAPDDLEPYEAARAEQAKPTLVSKLFGGAKRTEKPPNLEMSQRRDFRRTWIRRLVRNPLLSNRYSLGGRAPAQLPRER